MKRSTVVGLLLTIGWVVAFSALMYLKRSTLCELTLNEWGDFFAGAVAPLAFFWLVLGYLQQGEELRLNTEALKAQHKELQRQVEETALLAAHSGRQAQAAELLASATQSEAQRKSIQEIADAQPLLVPNGGFGISPNGTFNVLNNGATVFDVSLKCEAAAQVSIDPKSTLGSGAAAQIQFRGVSGYPFAFEIAYTDRLGLSRSQRYEATRDFQFALARET